MTRFHRLVALVTDADNSLARVVATRLAADGASLVLQHRRDDAHAEGLTRAFAAQLVSEGGQAVAVPADLTDPAGVLELTRAIKALAPRMHALIHTATTGLEARATADGSLINGAGGNLTFCAAMKRDVDSLLLSSQLCAPLMDAGGAAILSLLPLSARDGGSASSGASAVSSGAALALVRTLARDLGPRDIRVNALLCDMERVAAGSDSVSLAEASAIAGSAAFLLSPEASYVTGAILPVEARARSQRTSHSDPMAYP